ncbi:MAG: helicase-related protein [Candidatus Aenigmatarchaeota archaeon]
MSDVKIIRVRNLVIIEVADEKLRSRLFSELVNNLSYYELDLSYKYSYGHNKPQLIFRSLYKYDTNYRLITLAGLLDIVEKVIKKHTDNIKFIWQWPEKIDGIDINQWLACYEPNWDNVYSKFSFRPGQEEALRIISNSTHGIIKAPTGFGKMILIAMTCCLYPKATIDIVTKRRDLIKQLLMCLAKYLPDVSLGKPNCSRQDRVMIWSAMSYHHSRRQPHFLLGDEVHELAAKQISTKLTRSYYSRNFGFSATPLGRLDKADLRTHSLFGPIIYNMCYSEAVARGLVVPIEVIWYDTNYSRKLITKTRGYTGVQLERWAIWRNDERNALIAAVARQYEDKQVQIVVRTVEHGLYLRKFLPEYTFIYDHIDEEDVLKYINKGLLNANEELLTPAKRFELRKQFEDGTLKKVISTYVWAVGIDAKNLDVVIRADACSSEILTIQVPGRVSRINEQGKSVGVLCDFLDSFHSALHSRANLRRKVYEKLGWSQTRGSIK